MDVESNVDEKTLVGLWMVMVNEEKNYFLKIEKLLGINVIHMEQ